jgi:hypothetical protein
MKENDKIRVINKNRTKYGEVGQIVSFGSDWVRIEFTKDDEGFYSPKDIKILATDKINNGIGY